MRLFQLVFCIVLTFTSTFAETPMSRDDLAARGSVPHDDFVILGTPKCGSHYIMAVVRNLLNQRVDEGYDWVEPELFSEQHKANLLNMLWSCKQRNIIHKSVIPHSPYIESTFLEAQHKWVFLKRDPRDALISLLFHMEARKWQGDRRDFLTLDSATYDQLSIDDKLTALMTGSCCQNYLTDFYIPMMGWAESPYGLVVCFEDLIGPSGKGSSVTQMETLFAIAEYLNCRVTKEELDAVALYSYGPWPQQQLEGELHERGQIGSWRKFFKEHHKSVFKQLYGKKLILYGYENDYDW